MSWTWRTVHRENGIGNREIWEPILIGDVGSDDGWACSCGRVYGWINPKTGEHGPYGVPHKLLVIGTNGPGIVEALAESMDQSAEDSDEYLTVDKDKWAHCVCGGGIWQGVMSVEGIGGRVAGWERTPHENPDYFMCETCGRIYCDNKKIDQVDPKALKR
jgi:hypothetical protein